MDSSDQMTATGLEVKKTWNAPDGSVKMTIEERFPLISESEYRKRYDAIYPGCAEEAGN